MYLKRKGSRFVQSDDGWTTDIELLETKGDRALVRYANRDRWYWILPDGSISLISTHPVKRYLRTLDGYRPSHSDKIGFTVSGVFPFFRVDQTGDWVWLDYDGRLYHRYVNFVERCDAWIRLQARQNGRIPKTDRNPGERKRAAAQYTVKLAPAQVAGMHAYRWSVWRYGKEQAADFFITDDPDEATTQANRWIIKQRRYERKMERYLNDKRN